MPDHQQAAVLALFEKIMGEDPTTPAPVRFALLSDEDKRVFREALAAAEPHLRKKWAEGVVCLCGSTRFRAEIVEANRLLTLEGHIVLAPGVFGHDGDPITDDEKAKLDALHLRKIDMAEQVIVIAPGGYIGESTRREIAYAESTEKPVIIWNQIILEGVGE